MPRQRKPVGRGYREDFDLIDATVSALDVSMRLEAVWSGSGGGRGGRDLDDLLSDLGDAYIEAGVVKWDPPEGLDSTFIDYLSSSLRELNNRLQAGSVTIDDDGNIRPAESEQARRPMQAPRPWRR
jgi:hypothetical protein